MKYLKLKRESAYLYDAVMIYAESVAEIVSEEGDVLDGSLVLEHMVNRSYKRLVLTD